MTRDLNSAAARRAPIEDIIANERLELRPLRAPNYELETEVLRELSRKLSESPEIALKALVDQALLICRAESAGVSIAETDESGEIFRWHAVSGKLAPFLRATMPRHFSPCGEVVRRKSTLLMANMIRHYEYVDGLGMSLPEVLLVPFFINGQPVGTIWVVAHSEDRRFDLEDRRILESLAEFTSGIVQSYFNIRDARKTQKQLENERENFRRLYKQTPEMVCLTRGPEHVFEFVNEAHIKALGFDATGRSVRDAQPESVEVHGILDNVYQTGKTAELHEIPITLTDRLRYFNLTYSAYRDFEGNISGIMIIGAEVTNEVVTRELLKSQNQSLERILSGGSAAEGLAEICAAVERIMGRGIQASVTVLSDDGKHMLAGSPVSDPSTCWSTPIYSDKGSVIATFTLCNRATQEPSQEERQIVDLFVQTAAIIIGREIDAKDRRQAEADLVRNKELLGKSEQQLTLAIEVSRVGFYDWDILNDVITFSARMMEDWGITGTANMKIQDALARIHPDDRERVSTSIASSVGNKSPFRIEYRVVRPDKTVWVAVRGQLQYDFQGTPIRFFGTSIDITEQKERELRLQQAQAAAERANSAKGVFLANMSHEIRTPLGAIVGFLDLLKSPTTSQEDVSKYVGVIERNSHQLMRIVNDVLDLSKIEAGKFTVESIPFSLKELLSDFNSLMAFKAHEKGLTFDLKLDSPIPELVQSDPTRVRQILSNVVGNAIKFTVKGGVLLSVAYNKGVLTFRTKDTGPGISEDTVARLFHPFVQADESTTRLYGGTGLGLNLTRRLSQALGGGFVLEKSEPGQGSVFTATVKVIPAREAKMINADAIGALEPAIKNAAHTQSRLSGLNILIVDDSPDNQELLQVLLAGWGARIAIANNGKEGVNVALTANPDVVLMDVQMPVMDGHEAVATLRAQGFTKPIVALTAHAMNEEKARCEASGFSHFLSKPINKDGLLSVLKEIKGATD